MGGYINVIILECVPVDGELVVQKVEQLAVDPEQRFVELEH